MNETAIRRTWQEWDDLFQYQERIMDPDGFRGRHRNEDDLYTQDEFLKGRMLCTLVSRREFPSSPPASERPRLPDGWMEDQLRSQLADRLTPEQMDQFIEEVNALVDKFAASNGNSSNSS